MKKRLSRQANVSVNETEVSIEEAMADRWKYGRPGRMQRIIKSAERTGDSLYSLLLLRRIAMHRGWGWEEIDAYTAHHWKPNGDYFGTRQPTLEEILDYG